MLKRVTRVPKQTNKLDLAARAAWLYYASGNTQEEIAAKLNLSRPGAQRLIALAMEEGIVKVRINHPITGCMATWPGTVRPILMTRPCI
jgi:DNA-binding transcriptional regulator LsrR (DeoR family)